MRGPSESGVLLGYPRLYEQRYLQLRWLRGYVTRREPWAPHAEGN